MRILICEQDAVTRADTLSEALAFAEGTAVFLGGEDVCGVVTRLAQELSGRGRRVLTATLDGAPEQAFYAPEAEEEITTALGRGESVTVGRAGGLEPQEIDRLRALCDVMLIKAQAAPEGALPALPEDVELLVGMADARALGEDAVRALESLRARCADAVSRYTTLIVHADDGKDLENALRAGHLLTRAVLLGQERTDAV